MAFILQTAGRAAVRSLDRVLSRLQRIEAYSRRPDCLFRIALVHSPENVRLADGVEVRRGEPVGELHYWNEHMPTRAGGTPALAWALATDAASRRSLRALAEFVEADPRFRDVGAFTGLMTGLPVRGASMLAAVARRLGFEAFAVGPPHGVAGRLHLAGEDLLLRMLAWAYNPSSLGRGAAPARCRLWMSRRMLLDRYGPDVPT